MPVGNHKTRCDPKILKIYAVNSKTTSKRQQLPTWTRQNKQATETDEETPRLESQVHIHRKYSRLDRHFLGDLYRYLSVIGGNSMDSN